MNSNSSLSTKPLVSVVTPFYNTAEYLAECIESVLRQSYDNWEYILLNNCSTDGSDQIARQYAAKDSRIRLLSNDTLLPQVQNYNAALSYISPQSSYCKIVQADDWIYPECLERMVGLAEAHPSVGIVSSYSLRGDAVWGLGLPYTVTVTAGAEVCRLQLTTGLFLFGSPTTVLYRSEIIRKTARFFDQGALHDDTDACYRTLRNCDFGFIHQVLSFLRVGNDSITSRVKSFGLWHPDRFLQLTKFGPTYLEPDELSRLLEAHQTEYYRFLARRFLAGGSEKFWQYHTSALESGGERLEKRRLLKHACLELLKLVVNPGFASVRLYDLFRTSIAGKGKTMEDNQGAR
jgi:glycosyltransferase involved in cell wall biosynthesis